MITQNMDKVHQRPHVLGAWIEEVEIGWHFHIHVDEGDQDAHLSAIISKRFDSYDAAVIAMNKALLPELERGIELERDLSDA